MNLKGLGVAIITPFKEDFSVDFRALTKLINHVIDGGVDYIVSLGTTGESVVLNDQEKTSVVEHTINTVEKRVPICLGIGGNDTMAIVDKIKKTNFSNISAILSVSPYYNKPSQEGIFLHYKLISESSNVPIILYNVPGRTSCDISNDTIVRLSEYSDKIIGIKEASGDVKRIIELRKKIKRKFLIISGDDFTMIDAVRNGADGIISVAANAFPSIMNSTYISLIWENDKQMPNNIKELGTVDSSTFLLNDFFELIFEEGNPSGIKFALQCLNLCNDKVRLPLTGISEDLKSRISNFIHKNSSDE